MVCNLGWALVGIGGIGGVAGAAAAVGAGGGLADLSHPLKPKPNSAAQRKVKTLNCFIAKSVRYVANHFKGMIS